MLSRDFQQYFKPLLSSMNMLGLMKTDSNMADSEVTPEYLVDNIWVVGSPDEVAEKLRRLHHDVGGFGVLLAMAHEWLPEDRWQRSMTLLARRRYGPTFRSGIEDVRDGRRCTIFTRVARLPAPGDNVAIASPSPGGRF